MSDRKARLAALAAKAGRAKETPSVEDENTNTAADSAVEVSEKATTTPTVKFRNYTPAHGRINEQNAAQDEEEPSSKRSKQEEPAPSALEQALAKAKAEAAVSATGASRSTNALQQTGNLGVVAPKKANWDLKRDIQPKLDKLEKRTQKAIVQLLKERLQQEATAADNVD
jgi:coiled-coil domain-containing protein 12